MRRPTIEIERRASGETSPIRRASYLLPGADSARAKAGLFRRLFEFICDTWGGRLFLAAFLCGVVEKASGFNVPLPWKTTLVVALIIYGRGAVVRTIRSLFYRVRSKLLIAYVLTAVVPLALGVLFAFVAGSLLLSVFASRLVSTELEHHEATLGAAAATALSVAGAGGASAAEINSAFASVEALHEGAAWAVVRNGAVVAEKGQMPHAAPKWIEGDRLSALVRDGARQSLRAVARKGGLVAIVEAPYDESLFTRLERESGIRVVSLARTGEIRRSNVNVSGSIRGTSSPFNLGFAASHDQFDWETGARSVVWVTFGVDAPTLYRSLTPGKDRLSQILLLALGVLAVVFASFYLIALLFGGALVRSITRAVHALSVGTMKLQGGDFSHRIIVRSEDQLGDLAQSFNSMSQGIEDLLEQQGEKERMEEDLRVARNIQMSLLPQEYVEVEGLKIAAVCLPANEMGGDYYDLLPLANDRLGVLIADVSGKGTSAALYMAELKGLILSLSRNHASPKDLLSELNEILAPNLDRRSFVTMTYAVIDSKKRTLRVARAGHNPLIHFDGRTGQTRLLSPPGLALGFDSGDRFRAIIEEVEMPLVPGDSFLFFTDGISEAMNGSAELFGEGRLASILKEANQLSSDELKERILREVRMFAAGESPHDDMTLVIVKVV